MTFYWFPRYAASIRRMKKQQHIENIEHIVKHRLLGRLLATKRTNVRTVRSADLFQSNKRPTRVKTERERKKEREEERERQRNTN